MAALGTAGGDEDPTVRQHDADAPRLDAAAAEARRAAEAVPDPRPLLGEEDALSVLEGQALDDRAALRPSYDQDARDDERDDGDGEDEP